MREKIIDMTDERLLELCIDSRLYDYWAAENGQNGAINHAAMALDARLKGYCRQIESITEQRDALRCCGNCERYYDNGMQTYCFANKTVKASRPNSCCEDWQFDGKKERNMKE